MKIAQHGAIVTGGASGLGEALVAALQARGAKVTSLDLARSALADFSLVVDITDESAVEQAIEDAHRQLGRIHFVFNCAGIGLMEPIVQNGKPAGLESLRKLLDVNLVGTYNVIRFAAPKLIGNEPDDGGERGVIINTSSISAMDGPAAFAGYSASKAGVAAMTAPLALDLGPHGIRVCAIAPGMFQTPMQRHLPGPVRQEMIRHMIFPRRAGDPQRFADLALHIVENDYINATTIRIDAGARAPLPS